VLLALLRDFIIFTRGHETQTTLGRELFSLLPSSSFFLLCGSLYGRLCALKRTRPAAVYIELSERWMKRRKKGHEKRQPRTYCTSPQTLDVHSVLLRWVANSTRNSPPKQTSKQSPTLFVFLKCVCSRIVRLFSCCAARIKCHDEFLN
jgi:hypothetical protein